MTAPLLLAAALLAAADPPAVAPHPRPAESLPPGAVARMGSPRLRHPGGLQTLAFGLGGKVLVSAHEPVACVWDAESGQLLRLLGTEADEEGTDRVTRAGVLADGQTLVVTGNRRVGRRAFVARSFVWDLERDTEARVFHVRQEKGRGPHSSPGVFAPDGSRLAEVESFGTAIHLFDRDGKPAGRLDGAVDPENWGRDPAVFSPDGKFLYVGREEVGVVVWATATRERVRTFGGGNSVPKAVAVSADGRLVVTFDAAKPKHPRGRVRPETVRVWNPATGKPITEIGWDGADPAADYRLFAGFLADGSAWAVAASSAAVTYRRWDRETGRQTHDWTTPLVGWEVGVADVSPDGARLAVGGRSGVISVFDAATGRDVTPAGGHRDEVRGVRFTPDGRHLVTAGDDGTVRVWDAATGAEIRVLRGLGFPWLSPDGTLILDHQFTGTRGTPVTATVVRDATDGRERWRLDGAVGVTPLPDGKTAWRRRPDEKSAAVVDLATGKELRAVPAPGYPVGFAADGRLVVVRQDAAASGWDPTTGEKRFAWNLTAAGVLAAGDGGDRVIGQALSPDGKRLAFAFEHSSRDGADRGALVVCEAATGKEVARTKSADYADFAFGRVLAFSPDGKLVATGGRRARLFDAATGEERAAFDGHRFTVSAVAFSPDGRRLATGGSDGTAVVWEVPRR
ncbi:MAG: hypothetical protein K2X82_05605 [Gemmataceae bacterium]|nr:hypothetical protein [Gemmataceae bacterium]